MNLLDHSELVDRHAFLSASSYHWINYDEDKLVARYHTWRAAQRGTELHSFAHQAINLGIKLPRSPKTLNMYVNDAIGYRMRTEQPLFFSENCFGTADTLSYRANTLRIHDLKTGTNKTSMKQLEVYTALFCLEYDMKLGSFDIELRIYQNDEINVHIPEVDEIEHIINKIVLFDRKIDQLKMEERQ